MTRGRLVCAALVAALTAAVLAGAPPAGAVSVKRVTAAAASRAGLLFHLPRLRPRAIRSARLIVRIHGRRGPGRRVYRLPVRRVRQAVPKGALTVRPPAPQAQTAQSSVLVLTVAGSGSRSVSASPPASVPVPVPAAPASVDGGAVASGTLLAAGCDPGWGSFAGAGVQPPGCWRPYAPTSPFNRTISQSQPAVGNSQAIVDRLVSFGSLQNLLAGTAGRGELDGGRPLYYSHPSDPVFTLHCTESWGTCALEGLQIHVPDPARPAGGSDAHLSVIDQASGWEYDLWGVQAKPQGGGTLTFQWGGKTRIDGSGLGSDAVAAQYGTAAGVLRAEELASGHINHALFLGVSCDSGHPVFPATKNGSTCSDPTNAPSEGTRFQLTLTDAQIQALPVPDWKKTIYTAMAHYGMIVGDTGGSWGIAQESGVVYTSFGQPDKWVTLAQQWHIPYYAPDQDYVFNLRDGIDWAHNLRVIDPCASQGTC